MDLPAVAAFARRHGLVSIIDATFATPINLRPLELGFDVVLHSATKYLSGHRRVGILGGKSAAALAAAAQAVLAAGAVQFTNQPNASLPSKTDSDVIAGVVAGSAELVEGVKASANLLGCVGGV
jgi:cystathionine beta-lyase/cystathionine gamma-synthase